MSVPYYNFTGYEAGDRTDEASGTGAVVLESPGHHAGSKYILRTAVSTGTGGYFTYPVDSAALWTQNVLANGSNKKGICRRYFRINTAYPTAKIIVAGFGVINSFATFGRMSLKATGKWVAEVGPVVTASADSASALVVDTWYRADISIDYAADVGVDTCTVTVSVYADDDSGEADAGTLLETLTVTLTQTFGSLGLAAPSVGDNIAAAHTRSLDYDDGAYALDVGVGIAMPTLPSATRVWGYVPVANGSVMQFAGGDYTNVDERPVSTSGVLGDTLTSATLNQQALFAHASAASQAMGAPVWLKVSAAAKVTIASSHALVIAGVDTSLLFPNANYTFHNLSALDLVGYTVAQFNTLEFGVAVRTASRTVTLGAIVLEVLAALAALEPVTITPTTLATHHGDDTYGQALTGHGGDGGPYTFAVVSGALPDGLAMSSGGLLSGIPTRAGMFSFTVRATDGDEHTGDQAYWLLISSFRVNATPYEIIAGPWTLWVAPAGTTFPAIVDEPDSSDWTLVGNSGALNYDEMGLTVVHAQTIVFRRSLTRPGPRRVVRVDESVWIRVTVADLTLEQYRRVLNDATITTTDAGPGVAGAKKIGLLRGPTVVHCEVLVRGPSPYMADGALQYEIPVAVQVGQPQPIFRRDQPAGLALEWQALIDPDALTADEQHGRLVAQVA